MARPKPEVKILKAEYLLNYPECQYRFACGRYVQFPPHFGQWLELDHIWGRGKYGDHWTNYATASPGAHTWKHTNQAVARIAIMHYKLRLAKETDDWRHFDLERLELIAGKSILGWVENQLEGDTLPVWCQNMAATLLDECF